MSEGDQKYFEYRVGNISKSTATLIDLDYNILDLPLYLLPAGSEPGSIVKIILTRDENEEQKRNKEVDRICQKVIKGLEGINSGNKIL